MKGVELYAQVRFAVQIEGVSRREAARRFGIDPRTVAKMLAFPVPRWHRKRQHLRDRPRVDPKTSRRFPPAHTFNLNRKPYLSVKLHTLHPPAPAACRQRPSAAGFLLRRYRITRPLQ